MHAEDVLRAGRLADDHSGVSARDLVHWAVMQQVGAERIITVDTDFDRLTGVMRLDPVDVGKWGTEVITLQGD